MPTLKNKKICEDVPPQLDLGPRLSFDSGFGPPRRALGRVSRVSPAERRQDDQRAAHKAAAIVFQPLLNSIPLYS